MAKTARADSPYEPTVVFPPGETLAEVLADVGMTQAELAKRTGLSTKHVNQIIKGSAPITPETALLLERVTGVPSRVWNNLEVRYQEHRSRHEEETHLSQDLGWLDELPLNQLIRRGWIERCREPIDQLREVCRFFGVADRSAWEALWHKPTALRTSKAFTSDPAAVAAWLRIGEIKAASIDCAQFDRTGLVALIEDLRRLTRDPDPQSWWPILVRKCASVGIAVVAEPEIKGARVNGAARWLTPSKALVQLSLRHRWSDIMWFTFFHELGHLIMHSKKETFINDSGVHSGVEQEADAYAAQTLIPRQFEVELTQLSTVQDVKKFAHRIGVAPGIVVGRLQHDKLWAHNRGNGLRQRFVFSG